MKLFIAQVSITITNTLFLKILLQSFGEINARLISDTYQYPQHISQFIRELFVLIRLFERLVAVNAAHQPGHFSYLFCEDSHISEFTEIPDAGCLLLVSLAATTLIEGVGTRLKEQLPDVTVVVFYIINLILNLTVTTLLFAIIFKVLPDAKIKWKDIWPGAIATSLLFLVGKFAISFYISKSDIGSTFGAAGSLVILLVWVYYSAIILYFGAEFTKAYALNKGARIIPNEYAQWNQEAVVTGAKTQDHKNEKISQPQVASAAKPIDFANTPVLPQKNKNAPGMGAVLLGLLLYLVKPRKHHEA